MFDDLQQPAAVLSKAHELVKVISSVARVRRSIAKPISLTGLDWRDSGGIWRRTLTVTTTIVVYKNITRLTAPGAFERCVELALKNERVRSNLDDLRGEWDFPRLRRIGETILLDIGGGDIRKGLKDVVKRGWASKADCELFWETVNHGDARLPGAHSALRRAPAKNPKNVIEAGEFLNDLVAAWLESKM